MIYAALTIFSSLLISILLKLSENRNGDRIVVAGANYVSAALLGFIFSESIPLSPAAIIGGTLVGCGFVAGFLLLMKNIRQVGLAVTVSVARISTLGPVLLSIIFYSEHPGVEGILGIILGLVSFLFLGLGQRQQETSRPESREGRVTTTKRSLSHLSSSTLLLLLLLFLVMVFNDFSMKVAEAEGLDRGSSLLVVFGSAGLLCGLLLMIRRARTGESDRVKRSATSISQDRVIRPVDLSLGLLLGVPNFFSSYFLLHALESFPGSILFPAISAGGVVATTLTAFLFFGERPSRPVWIGIVIAILAVILLGMSRV